MTREEAIRILNELKPNTAISYGNETAYSIGQALTMAIQALENIGHLKDRPCDVCKFHKENGCSKWDCVFDSKASVKPQEPKTGHWDYTDAYPHWVCCDKCKTRFIPNKEWIKAYNIPTNYCPNCGARMSEVSE